MTYTKPSRARVFAAFANMRIRHPRIPQVYEKLNDAREAAQLTPFEPKRYVEFFAPSHSGKSMAIRSYIEDVVVDQVIARGLFPADMDRQQIAAKQRLVLHVTLSPKATRKSLAADILRQLGDPRYDHHQGPVLMRRVYEYLAGTYKDPATGEEIGKQTELVILDEIQHFSASTVSSPDGDDRKAHKLKTTEVTDTLKTMMIQGLVPMVFVGIPEARKHLAIDRQLTNREMDKIDFSPLRWSDEDDQAIFLEYCIEAAALIREHGLMRDDTDLVADDIPHALWAASAGCIGVVSRILEEATLHALARDADAVELEDLALAVDTRAIPNNYCTYNPFREGAPRGRAA